MKNFYRILMIGISTLSVSFALKAQPTIKITEDPKANFNSFKLSPLNLINDVNAGQDPDYVEYQANWGLATFATGTPIQNSTYLIFDLGQEEVVSSVGIAFNYECCVKYYFGVEIAGTDSIYSPAIPNASSTFSGLENAPIQYFPFAAAVTGRYVKLLMKGSSSRSENAVTQASMNLMEVRIISDKRPEYPYLRTMERVEVVRGSDVNLEGLFIANMEDMASDPSKIIYTVIGSGNGTIFKNNDTVRSGDVFSQNDINTRLVKFKHNNAGGPSAQFSFTLKTLNGIVTSDTIVKRIKVYPKGNPIVYKNTSSFGGDPYKSIDGQKASEWRVDVGGREVTNPFIIYDFGYTTDLNSLSISFSSVQRLTYSFSIGTSADGRTFKDSTYESLLNSATQEFVLPSAPTQTRFIKLTFNSNSIDTAIYAIKETAFNKTALSINALKNTSDSRAYTYKSSPSTSTFVIEGKENGEVRVSVINALGNEVYNTSYTKSDTSVSTDIPLSNLRSGVYYIKCSLNAGYLTEKMLVE